MPDEQLPLTLEFQRDVVRMLCEDRGFAAVALKHLRPQYFSNPMLMWCVEQATRYADQYGMPPPLPVLVQQAQGHPDPAQAANTTAFVQSMVTAPAIVPDVQQWLRDKVLDFCREQHARETLAQAVTLANSGQMPTAHAYLSERMREHERIRPTNSDRSDFFPELAGRLKERRRPNDRIRIPTGLPSLDKILHGGLAKGELGLWLAYAKGGKTTLLTNLGAAAARSMRRVLHLVYEGRTQQVEARYDAIFAGYDYRAVCQGKIPDEIVAKMDAEYQLLTGMLVIRGFTTEDDDVWNCSVDTIVRELAWQKQTRSWVPDLIIIDYGDLLQGRDKGARSMVERQTAAYQDMKTLANQGYAVWTASQPQRPKEDADSREHLIKSPNVADCYAKIRIVDFVGSVNMTSLEREQKKARVYAELYRDGAADVEFPVSCDLSTMTIREDPTLTGPWTRDASTAELQPFTMPSKVQAAFTGANRW